MSFAAINVIFQYYSKKLLKKKNKLFHTVRRSITKSNLSWKFRCKFIEMCLIQLSGFCSVVLKDLFQPLYCIDWMEDIQLDHPIVSAAGYPPNFNWIYARGVTKTYKTKCWPLSESNFSFFLFFFYSFLFLLYFQWKCCIQNTRNWHLTVSSLLAAYNLLGQA